MPEPLTMALLAGGAIFGGLQSGFQASAQHAVQEIQYNQEMLNGWLSIDQANFAAALNNAQQESQRASATTEIIKGTARAQVATELDFDKVFEDMSRAFSSNRAATEARMSVRGNKGGSAEAVRRQLNANARRQVEEIALQQGLVRRQIQEQRDAAFNQTAALNIQDASFFMPGTRPTDNSVNALISGAFAGAQQGLRFGSNVVGALDKKGP